MQHEYSPLLNHRNEEARSRYSASLFKVVLSTFHGTMVNRPEEIVQGQLTASGKIEHVFSAFSASVIVFVEAKFELTGTRRDQAIAQVMAECDGLDFANSNNGYWCPILGILTDGISFKLFVYDSTTREVFCSPSESELQSTLYISILCLSITPPTSMPALVRPDLYGSNPLSLQA